MNPAALADLRDIHLPPPPALAGLAADPWQALALLAAALALLAAAVRWLYRYRQRRRLREALAELLRIEARHRCDGDTTALACGVSRLLRRYALVRFPTAAGLAGRDWLLFLDAHGGGGAFAAGGGSALAWRPYRRDGAIDAAALIVAVRRWLEANPA